MTTLLQYKGWVRDAFCEREQCERSPPNDSARDACSNAAMVNPDATEDHPSRRCRTSASTVLQSCQGGTWTNFHCSELMYIPRDSAGSNAIVVGHSTIYPSVPQRPTCASVECNAVQPHSSTIRGESGDATPRFFEWRKTGIRFIPCFSGNLVGVQGGFNVTLLLEKRCEPQLCDGIAGERLKVADGPSSAAASDPPAC
jgi:hypothetical protein